MGNRCCHEGERKEEDLTYMKAVTTTMGDEGGLRRNNSEEELCENTIANPVIQFQTHERIDKGRAKRPPPRKDRLLIKLKTEANLVELCHRTRQMSLELRDSINCTFLDQLPAGMERERKKSPEISPKRTSSAEIDKRWSTAVRAETEVVISLEKRMVICPTPSHFRRENKNVMEDKYEILKPIGKGAYGEVKMIKEKTTGQIRAVKIMPKSTCQMTSNFVDEIKILQKLVRRDKKNNRNEIGPPERAATLRVLPGRHVLLSHHRVLSRRRPLPPARGRHVLSGGTGGAGDEADTSGS